jgi:NAD(P)-dependent dehydrogenase (short-subunit alcohol dehydrogenase family)
MELDGRVTVVTGGAGGLGRAVCRRFRAAGAQVVVVDLPGTGVEEIAAEIDGVGVVGDVREEADVQRAIDAAEAELGPVDLYFSNAGGGGGRSIFSPDEDWQSSWQLHVMSPVYAARALLPKMLERGEGYLLSTASGAALTTEPGTVTYSVTKHGTLALAEWMSIEYASRGVRVSCFCPFGMLTPMLLGEGVFDPEQADPSKRVGMRGAVTAEEAADAVVDGIRAERFLILSHPEALTFFRRKADDYDRWLAGMRRLYDR